MKSRVYIKIERKHLMTKLIYSGEKGVHLPFCKIFFYVLLTSPKPTFHSFALIQKFPPLRPVPRYGSSIPYSFCPQTPSIHLIFGHLTPRRPTNSFRSSDTGAELIEFLNYFLIKTRRAK